MGDVPREEEEAAVMGALLMLLRDALAGEGVGVGKPEGDGPVERALPPPFVWIFLVLACGGVLRGMRCTAGFRSPPAPMCEKGTESSA